jgi:glucokinase
MADDIRINCRSEWNLLPDTRSVAGVCLDFNRILKPVQISFFEVNRVLEIYICLYIIIGYKMSNPDILMGVDIGGSHIAAALLMAGEAEPVGGSYFKQPVRAMGTAEQIIEDWMRVIGHSLHTAAEHRPKAIGIAIPGPFDYGAGISLISGVNKYEALYGKNIGNMIRDRLGSAIPVYFENDAACFGLAQVVSGTIVSSGKILAITLGTGIGSAFVDNGELITEREDIPANGYLYNAPYRDGIAEDHLSGRWLTQQYLKRTGIAVRDVKTIAIEAAEHHNENARALFYEFGRHLGNFLAPWLIRFKADQLVLGGGIMHAAGLFLPAMQEVFNAKAISLNVKTTIATELAVISGAAFMASRKMRTC